MNAYTMAQSYDRYGGHLTISIVGQLIEEHLGALDHGIETFETVAYFRTECPPRRTLENRHRDFHNNLAKLPTTRWTQKKQHLVIHYESNLGLAEDVFGDYEVDHALLLRAIDELEGVLRNLLPKLKKKKGLDIATFLEGFGLLNRSAPGSSEALAEFGSAHTEKKKEERSKLSWDQQLEIDWTEYHPSARELLNDPFFWSSTDGRSPHGNDTGADLLADFRDWNRKDPNRDCWAFFDQLISSWGMTSQIESFRAKPVSDYSSQDEISLVVHDEAVVALAFAEIKLRGACSSRTADEALASIDRVDDAEVRAALGWPAPDGERSDESQKLKSVLLRFSSAASQT